MIADAAGRLFLLKAPDHAHMRSAEYYAIAIEHMLEAGHPVIPIAPGWDFCEINKCGVRHSQRRYLVSSVPHGK